MQNVVKPEKEDLPDKNFFNLKVKILDLEQLSKYNNIDDYERELKAIKGGEQEEEDKEEHKVTQKFKMKDYGWNNTHQFVDAIMKPQQTREEIMHEKIASMKRQLAMPVAPK